MAELDYDALQRLADAATLGPWFQGRGNQRFENPREVYSKREPEEEDSHDIATFVWSDEDAEFIVASRSAIPALLDRVRGLEAERDAALARIAELEQNLRIEALARMVNGTLLHEYERRFAEAAKLHQPEVIGVHEGHGEEVWCPHCEKHWPCPTAVLLELNEGENDD